MSQETIASKRKRKATTSRPRPAAPLQTMRSAFALLPARRVDDKKDWSSAQRTATVLSAARQHVELRGLADPFFASVANDESRFRELKERLRTGGLVTSAAVLETLYTSEKVRDMDNDRVEFCKAEIEGEKRRDGGYDCTSFEDFNASWQTSTNEVGVRLGSEESMDLSRESVDGNGSWWGVLKVERPQEKCTKDCSHESCPDSFLALIERRKEAAKSA
mmetsp:Transcript_31779/g.64905  ORF Transcript_31779/g.64905 Transcript_31779/m.64905 type:complete len:219 (-) Transcript_31779:248-904(-)